MTGKDDLLTCAVVLDPTRGSGLKEPLLSALTVLLAGFTSRSSDTIFRKDKVFTVLSFLQKMELQPNTRGTHKLVSVVKKPSKLMFNATTVMALLVWT